LAVIHTGAFTAPKADLSSRKSPVARLQRAAVSGCTSTQPCHAILETGSGSSCSQGLLAPRPSCSTGCGNTTTVAFPSSKDGADSDIARDASGPSRTERDGTSL